MLEGIEVVFRNEALQEEGYLLEMTGAGEFLVPLRGVAGESGLCTFEPGLGLRNEFGAGQATFADVRLVDMEDDCLAGIPGEPELWCPLPGMVLSNCAVKLRWRITEHDIPLMLNIGTWPGLVDRATYRSLSLSEAECLLLPTRQFPGYGQVRIA